METNKTELLSPSIQDDRENPAEDEKVNENEGSDSEDTIQRDSKPKKLPKIIINTSKTRSELTLIQHLVEKYKKFGWATCKGRNGNILWSGLEIPFEECSIATEIRVNRIPGIRNIAEKKETGFYLNKFREYYPDDFDFFPRTFLYPEEAEQFEKHLQKYPKRLYIAKPTSGSHGDGITLVRSIKDLPISKYATNVKDMVIQEYIDRPLLIDGKKFDLRLYVLISSVKPMIAFLNEEGLARFCTEDYQPPTKENLKNYYMHLTNYNLNKLSPNYKYTEEYIEINDGSKRTLTSLWKSVEKAGYSKETIMKQIRDLVQKLLVSIQPIIQFNYNTAFEGKDNGKCFHVLGIDVLIDQDLKPWLIEINGNPSLNIEHELEQTMDKRKAPTIISPVDKFVKEKVMEDAILISRKKPEKQARIQKYGSYEIVYNSEDSAYKEKQLFKDILTIFGKLSGTRYKTHLVSGKFVKLASLPGMVSDKLCKADYDILYKKIVQQSEDKQMSFATFIMAIETLATKLIDDLDPENKKDAVEALVGRILSGFDS